DPILVVDDVVRRFGGLTAVDVKHVEFQRGSITALIGPNGAGKTTFFNQLTGFDTADSGQWTFNGRKMNGVPAHKVARAGMVRTFQLTKALSRLTVLENMRLGAQGQSGESFWQAMLPFLWRSQEDEITARSDERLAVTADLPGALPGGRDHRPRRRAADPVQARRQARGLRRLALGRPAQAAGDGPRPHGQARTGDARRADGRRQPGPHPVAAGA